MGKFKMSWVQSGDKITASLLVVEDKKYEVVEQQAGLRSFDNFEEARKWAHEEAARRGFSKIEISPDSPS